MDDILKQLEGNAGWISAVATWLFAAQTFAKLVQPRVTEGLTRLFSAVLSSDTKDDDEKMIKFLSSFRYWIINEVLDLVFRVKLPTLEDFKKVEDSNKKLLDATETKP